MISLDSSYYLRRSSVVSADRQCIHRTALAVPCQICDQYCQCLPGCEVAFGSRIRQHCPYYLGLVSRTRGG